MLPRPPGEWGLPEREGDAGGQHCGLARGQAEAMTSPQCHDPFVLESNSLPLEIMNLLWILIQCEKSFEASSPSLSPKPVALIPHSCDSRAFNSPFLVPLPSPVQMLRPRTSATRLSQAPHTWLPAGSVSL